MLSYKAANHVNAITPQEHRANKTQMAALNTLSRSGDITVPHSHPITTSLIRKPSKMFKRERGYSKFFAKFRKKRTKTVGLQASFAIEMAVQTGADTEALMGNVTTSETFPPPAYAQTSTFNALYPTLQRENENTAITIPPELPVNGSGNKAPAKTASIALPKQANAPSTARQTSYYISLDY